MKHQNVLTAKKSVHHAHSNLKHWNYKQSIITTGGKSQSSCQVWLRKPCVLYKTLLTDLDLWAVPKIKFWNLKCFETEIDENGWL